MNMVELSDKKGCSSFDIEDGSFVANRYISKGEILKKSALKRKPVVISGEKVKAYVIFDGIKIGIKVTVLNDAGYGEEVKLFDRNSLKVYKTVVYDRNKIIINMEGRSW